MIRPIPAEDLTARSPIKLKIVLLTTFLIAANAAFWLVTWLSSREYVILLTAGWLAYGFGLRHAVDADHISAIDNTTRRLMQMGKRPVGVGFFFSLGHSTIVLVLCMALALGAAFIQAHIPEVKAIGAVAGALVSSVFLYLIGIINLVVLIDLYRSYRTAGKKERSRQGRKSSPYYWGEDGRAELRARGARFKLRRPGGGPSLASDPNIDRPLENRGLLCRLLSPLLKLVRHSWQMYFIGLLFGLGFDTATEVGILALSAKAGGAGTPLWAIMLLPLLFTVGMCLVDTLDGILMLGAYGWAFVRPARKLYYNVSITTLSVLVAFVVGTAELAQLLAAGSHSALGQAIARIDLDSMGFAVVGIFALVWAGSIALSRRRIQKA